MEEQSFAFPLSIGSHLIHALKLDMLAATHICDYIYLNDDMSTQILPPSKDVLLWGFK
jgi:hypothetical protein